MKKIIINGRFLTSPQTGVQRTAAQLVKALDEAIESGLIDFPNTSLVLIYSGNLVNALSLKHIKIVKRGLLTGNLWEQLELPLYSAGHLLINLCSIAPLLKRKQMVMVHDVSFMVNKNFFSRGFRLWYATAIPILAALCRQVITVSNFSKSELITHLSVPKDKITVIYNAAEHILNFKAPSESFSNKINALKPYCLAVSSLGANKNFKGLTAAVDKIDFGNYNLLIAGGGLSGLNNETTQQGATYLGYVSDEELKYLYQNASLFVFPSFYEGFGIPPLEAMILGCPVAASNTAAMPEVLGDAVAYFNPHQVSDIGAKIEELIKNDNRLEELREKGYTQARKYSWQKSAAALYHLIQKHGG